MPSSAPSVVDVPIGADTKSNPLCEPTLHLVSCVAELTSKLLRNVVEPRLTACPNLYTDIGRSLQGRLKARGQSCDLGVLEQSSLLFAKRLQWVCHSRAQGWYKGGNYADAEQCCPSGSERNGVKRADFIQKR
jgi:hypothetical protein